MIVYRVCTTDGVGEGIWYDKNGKQKNCGLPCFDFYHLPNLQMPLSEEHKNYISVVTTLEDLAAWFSKEDMEKIEPLGYFITAFEADDVKTFEYDKGKFHFIANKNSMRRIGVINSH